MRSRSLALVVREGKILMIQTYRFNRYIFELPGGGVEACETPEEAAIRELKEECGLDGKISRHLNTTHRKNGDTEYVFFVDVSAEQEPIVGYDPEVPEGEEQAIKNGADQHFISSRRGQTGAGQNGGFAVSIKALYLTAKLCKPGSNATNQSGGGIDLRSYGFHHGEVNLAHGIALGLDTDLVGAVDAYSCHSIQIDSTGQNAAMLMICMVAADFRAARR